MSRPERLLLTSVTMSFALAGLLVVLGLSMQAEGMVVGGIFTGARCLAGIIVLMGLTLSRRHPKDFPYGLYKLENMVAIVIGGLIMVGAYEMGKLAVDRIGDSSGLELYSHSGIAIMLVFGAIAFYWGVRKYEVGVEENCPGLLADAQLSFANALALAILSVGAGLRQMGITDGDIVCAIIVMVLLFLVGLKIVYEGVRVLLDASVERSVLEQARSAAESDPRISRVISVDGRNSGSVRFLRLAVEPADYDLRDSEAIAGDLRQTVMSRIKNVDEVVVEFSSGGERVITAAAPVENDSDSISEDLAVAPAVVLHDIEVPSGRVLRRQVVQNPEARGQTHPGINVAVRLAKRGVDTLVLKERPRDPDTFYTLDAYGMRLVVSPGADRLSDAEEEMKRAASTPGEGD